jgi:hypothetical protein
VDNPAVSDPGRNDPPSVAFRPDRRYTAAAGGGAVLAAAVLLTTDEAPGRLLLGLAVLVLLGYVLGDLVFSPRLIATTQGIAIRSPLTRAGWCCRPARSRSPTSAARRGLRSMTLEVDAGATLAVFSRRALNHDPEDAARLINACRPPRGLPQP